MPANQQEITANLERAWQSVLAAKQLAKDGFYDFAASRAYYSAFYAATAVLLAQGLEFGKHSGVIAAVHQHLIKTGKLDKQRGKELNWLYEMRNIGDYGVDAHVPREDAQRAIQIAEDFVSVIKSFLNK
jgi:uncharacterized protein (UPF0332 family)